MAMALLRRSDIPCGDERIILFEIKERQTEWNSPLAL